MGAPNIGLSRRLRDESVALLLRLDGPQFSFRIAVVQHLRGVTLVTPCPLLHHGAMFIPSSHLSDGSMQACWAHEARSCLPLLSVGAKVLAFRESEREPDLRFLATRLTARNIRPRKQTQPRRRSENQFRATSSCGRAVLWPPMKTPISQKNSINQQKWKRRSDSHFRCAAFVGRGVSDMVVSRGPYRAEIDRRDGQCYIEVWRFNSSEPLWTHRCKNIFDAFQIAEAYVDMCVELDRNREGTRLAA